MNRRVYPLVALIFMTLAALACGLPGMGGLPSSPNQVETIVAATIQALTPALGTEAAPDPGADALLPHPLYFLGSDSAGVAQVYRMETDGKTLRQITSEPAAVQSYDVSPLDASIAYVANNQLLFVGADGSGRRMLADGGAIDPNNSFITSLTNPVFSPNGQTIAYSYRGLILYSLATGVSTTAHEDIFFDTNTNSYLPAKLFIPQSYSPDGTKILVTSAIPNSDGIWASIYNLAADSMTDLTGGDGARLCCTLQAWTPDSAALYVGVPSMGMFAPGLWRVNAASGELTTLIAAEAGGGNYNLADDPYLAPDGQLYFFYANAPTVDGFINRSALQMVRSAPDGVTGRTVLRPETFEYVNEALWAPDASFVIVAKAPELTVYEGGVVELYYTDGNGGAISLLPFARQLKWGP